MEKLLYSDCSQLDWIQKTKLIDDLRLAIHRQKKTQKNYEILQTEIYIIERECLFLAGDKQSSSTMSMPSLETAMMNHTQQIKHRLIEKRQQVEDRVKQLKDRQLHNRQLKQRIGNCSDGSPKVDSYFDILSKVEQIQQKLQNNELHKIKLVEIIKNTKQDISRLRDNTEVERIRQTLSLKRRHMQYLNEELQCRIDKRQNQLDNLDRMIVDTEDQVWRFKEQSCKIRSCNGNYQEEVKISKDTLNKIQEDGRVLKNLLNEIKANTESEHERSTAGKRLKTLPSEFEEENQLDRTVVISPRKTSVKRK